MNFADRLKEATKQQEEIQLTAEVDEKFTEAFDELTALPKRELTPLDVLIAGFQVMEKTIDRLEHKEDKAFVNFVRGSVLAYTQDITEALFDVDVKLKPVEVEVVEEEEE